MSNTLNNKHLENDSFEIAMSKLENIVKKLDEGNQNLDETLALYEEGIRLYRYCNKKLEKAEQRISMIEDNNEVPFTALYTDTRED